MRDANQGVSSASALSGGAPGRSEVAGQLCETVMLLKEGASSSIQQQHGLRNGLAGTSSLNLSVPIRCHPGMCVLLNLRLLNPECFFTTLG